MRLLIVLVVTCALAWGLLRLLGDEGAPTSPVPEEARPPEPAAAAGPTHEIPTTVTLVLTVQTEGGNIPQKTRAGYRYAGDDRLRTVDRQGRVMFTDAPTGRVTLVARAPGYEEILQQRYLTGGLRTDAVLTLKRSKTRKKR